VKPYYQVYYWSSLFAMWIPHNFKKYSSLQAAKKEISSYKDHNLGVKFRIQKVEIIKVK
jgi:hypothetical protein